jgi:hypothetical protein
MALTGAQRGDLELERLTVRRDLWIGGALRAEPSRTCAISSTARQVIDDLDARHGGLGRVLDGDHVLHEITHRSHRGHGALVHEQLRRCRIERNVDGKRRTGIDDERVAVGGITDAKRRAWHLQQL